MYSDKLVKQIADLVASELKKGKMNIHECYKKALHKIYEEDTRELKRLVMSELGKRSGSRRRGKKKILPPKTKKPRGKKQKQPLKTKEEKRDPRDWCPECEIWGNQGCPEHQQEIRDL